ncbi:hypothetical protein GMDG_01956 [Pseudogymnoascus destructans 20631-21]|uniref:Uncharacterized protein n=1 Tax=Pseudogymnoascus destructans (strain ATCC MYA-4855 / 20631-21) TaxID=658429 RepID=L8FYA5_PSED2|nr:hypothetical protein GMDG_01956 [Pseudogymnoascus destructans 20631-21]
MSPSHKKHKHNRSASSDTPTNQSSTHHAGNSISSAAAELSRIHSLAQPPDIPTPADQDLKPSKRQRDRSIDSHTHGHSHHRHRHAARLALSSLLHESGTSGHFGLGLGIQRRGFGLDLDVDAKKNEGGESSGVLAGTERLKQLVKEVPRQLASEVPKQVGRYLEGRGEVRDEVAVGVGVRTRGTEVGVRVEAARGGFWGGEGGEVAAPQAEAAPPPAPSPQPAPAPEAAPAPQQPLTLIKSTTLQLAKRYSCHICRFINEEIERCASCGHRLCIDCEWLMPIAKIDGAAQEFAIYEDSDAMEARNTQREDQMRAENVYTPSEFEQENYVDSPDTPDLPPKVWARQAAFAKAHYTTPQSPTAGSPCYTTTQSPTIRSTPPSPVDLSHLSANDYPEPLRLAPSPVRPPGPRSRRVVKDNPFVVADQVSARHERVMRVDGDAGVRSRDGQASPQPDQYSARAIALTRMEEEMDAQRRMWQDSPQPGRYSARIAASRDREEEKSVQRRMWQTNRVSLPGFGGERESALRASRGEKMPIIERAARPKKLDPVMSETLTPSGSKTGGGNVVEEGGYHAQPVPDGGENGDEKRDGPESSTSGLHGDFKACPYSKAVQNSKAVCPVRSLHCGLTSGTQIHPV